MALVLAMTVWPRLVSGQKNDTASVGVAVLAAVAEGELRPAAELAIHNARLTAIAEYHYRGPGRRAFFFGARYGNRANVQSLFAGLGIGLITTDGLNDSAFYGEAGAVVLSRQIFRPFVLGRMRYVHGRGASQLSPMVAIGLEVTFR